MDYSSVPMTVPTSSFAWLIASTASETESAACWICSIFAPTPSFIPIASFVRFSTASVASCLALRRSFIKSVAVQAVRRRPRVSVARSFFMAMGLLFEKGFEVAVEFPEEIVHV